MKRSMLEYSTWQLKDIWANLKKYLLFKLHIKNLVNENIHLTVFALIAINYYLKNIIETTKVKRCGQIIILSLFQNFHQFLYYFINS